MRVVALDRNDALDLASTIEKLNNDRELRLTYANLAYNRARQRFTAERMVDDYISLYDSIMGASNAPEIATCAPQREQP